jgi:hypothetical protein
MSHYKFIWIVLSVYLPLAREIIFLPKNGEWHITVGGLAKVAILTTNVHTKHTLQIYEKLSYEALNRHFCQTAVVRLEW